MATQLLYTKPKYIHMSLIEPFKWRYAVKKFDSQKKLTSAQFNYLLESINLAPTSYGLQPFKVLSIESPSVREQLKAQAWGQSQVTDAAQVLIFAAQTTLSTQDVAEYVLRIAQTRNVEAASLEGYASMMNGTIQSRSAEQLTAWASRQAYIALGFLMAAAAEAGIDVCPMEGFDAAGFDDTLGLKEKGLTAVVMATIGFRAGDDGYQHAAKVRKTLDQLILKY